MKIKVTQLTEAERGTISIALRYLCEPAVMGDDERTDTLIELATSIEHGELLLCEYQYNQDKKES